MRYYAAWGHTEFVLCLGYKGDVDPRVLPQLQRGALQRLRARGARRRGRVELLNRDVGDWRITFVDTGMQSTIGERLKAVEPYLNDDEEFLATYGDGLTDAPLDRDDRRVPQLGKLIQFLSVRPQFNAHRDHGRRRDVVTRSRT